MALLYQWLKVVIALGVTFLLVSILPVGILLLLPSAKIDLPSADPVPGEVCLDQPATGQPPTLPDSLSSLNSTLIGPQ